MEQRGLTVDRPEAAAPFVLALDIGSSSVRSALVDGRGRRVTGSLSAVTYRVETSLDGAAEFDPTALAGATDGLIDAALRRAAALEVAIAAVAMTTFWHSLMGIDGSGRPTTTLTTWADTRAAGAVESLSHHLDSGYHARTGALPHPSYPATRIAWLHDASPEAFAATARWVGFGEFLFLRWFGQPACSISMASGTGLYDQTRLVWDPPSLEAVGITADHLSPVDDQPLQGLQPAYAARWPALAAIPWLPALGDGACSNVGVGAVTRGQVALTIGTSSAVRTLWRGTPVPPPPGLWLYRLDANHPVLGGALSEGGNLYRWARDTLRLDASDTSWEAVAAVPPDSHGLTWLPFLAGERSPGWAAGVRATITGITLDTTPVEILRAGLEAVAYRIALTFDLLDGAIPGTDPVVATGNALLSNAVWLQIIADVLGRPVEAAPEPEASLRGAALVALARIGAAPDMEQASGKGMTASARYEPDPAHHAVYQAAIARQRDIYRRIIGDHHAGG